MTGKEILLATLRGEQAERTPWVPFVGAHGGILADVDAETYLKSADRIVEGLLKARELYTPDGLPVAFDLQLEAEVLGCDLHWAKDGPPSVASHPLEEAFDLEALPAFDIGGGRFPLVFEATRRVRAEVGDELALYGLVCGPFTLALHLLGNNIFLEMFDNEEKVRALVMHCAEIACTVARGYLDAGCDVIAVVDPMVSQISPEHFRQFVAPGVDHVFDRVRELGALSSLFVCGDATRNIEAMCETRCDNISVDENVDLAALARAARAAGKSFGGNLKLTVVLLLGEPDDARLDAIRCLDAAGELGGFVLSPGCDLPYETPAANLQAAGEMALDLYKREVARTTLHAREAEDFSDISLPDYAAEKKVILDVITLDSATCAPCQYMVDAAEKAAAALEGPVEVREHKIKGREGIGIMVRLGLEHIPTICIDGTAAFVSIIPDQTTLRTSVAEALAKKGLG